MPVDSPWSRAPFAAPVPDDGEPTDPPRGRRPYSSPTAEPTTEPRTGPTSEPTTEPTAEPTAEPTTGSEAEPFRRPRRPVDRPDKLVATGPPRQEPIPVEKEIPAEPEELPVRERDEEPPAADGDEPVRRVGRPPGGRPTRPDLLVAQGPARPGSSGRHHRGPAPSATRRSSPVKRRRLGAPVAVIVALALIVTGGVLAWQWWNTPAQTGLRLAAGAGQSGDELFTVPSAGDGSNQKLNDVAAVGRTVVAVGSDTTSPVPRPLFLFSPDSGKSWQLGAVTESVVPTVQRVVGGDGLWLATGGDGVGDARGLWTSPDGYSWKAVEPGGLSAFRRGDLIHDIARTASGFVAVGRTLLQDGSSGPVAWHSPDGRAWTRVDSRDLGTPDQVREFKDVVAREDTVVVLAQPAEPNSSVVMRSADGGRTWGSTATRLADVTPRAGSLALLAEQFVLVPSRQRLPSGEVQVHCSPTGEQWTPCGTIGGIPAQSTGVNSVITYAAGIAAVSTSGLDNYTILTSADGRAWTKRANLGKLSDATLRGLAISDSGTLVIGGDRAAADVDNQLVLMTAAEGRPAQRVPLGAIEGLSRTARQTTRLAAADGRFVAVGSASGDAGIWTSTNARDWDPVTLGGPHQQVINDVAHGRKGWLAVGSSVTDVNSTEPLVVGSADGRAWKKIAASGPLARADGLPYLSAQVVAAGASGYVLAGEERGASGTAGAAIWFTPDLRKFTRSGRLPQAGAGTRIHDVTSAGKGYLAVGGSGPADHESGVVWASPDGLNWTARERVLPPGATSAGLRHVVSYGEQIVAVGTAQVAGSRRAFAAVSGDDGLSWTYGPWLPAEQAAAVHDLAAAAQGIVAVGWHGPPGSGDSAAWISEDGLTWRRQDLNGDRLGGEGMQLLGAVTVSGSTVLALGRSTTYSTDHLILWTSTLSSDR